MNEKDITTDIPTVQEESIRPTTKAAISWTGLLPKVILWSVSKSRSGQILMTRCR